MRHNPASSDGRVIISGDALTVEDVVDVARGYKPVSLSDDARLRMENSRKWVESVLRDGEMRVYGVNTGLGALRDRSLSPDQAGQLTVNMIRSHSVGVGEPAPIDVVRAAMLIRVNTMAKGFSGTRPKVPETLLEMLNKGVHPYVPLKGSVGASGDLAPLSHIALTLMGEGAAFYEGELLPAAEAMKLAGLEPVVPGAREGLALNNGTAFTTAMASLAVHDAENLVKNAEIALAMSLEALLGAGDAFNEHIHAARGHDGQIKAAWDVRALIRGSDLVDSKAKVQDAYSLRCAPQVMGAARDALSFARMVVTREMNAATDNPLIFIELERENKALSGGNFHGEPLALTMDLLGMAVAEIGNISERRVFRLLDGTLNEGLEPMLIENSGLNSGLMMLQYTAAALVSENKTLAHPDSVDSIPTSANQEDHVSMCTNAAIHATQILRNVEQVVAIEMITAAQALDLRLRERKAEVGIGTGAAYRTIRDRVPFVDADRTMYEDIVTIAEIVHNGEIVAAVEDALGLPLHGLAEMAVVG